MGRAGQARAEGTSAERRIGGEKRAGLQEQGRRGHPCSSAHSQVTNIHRMFLPMQDSWNPNWGKFQFSEDSHSSIWFRLPLYEKRAHWERQFGVSQWKNLPNAFSGQGLPGLSMFMMSSVETHIGFLNQTVYGMENIHLQSSKQRGMESGGSAKTSLRRWH